MKWVTVNFRWRDEKRETEQMEKIAFFCVVSEEQRKPGVARGTEEQRGAERAANGGFTPS